MIQPLKSNANINFKSALEFNSNAVAQEVKTPVSNTIETITQQAKESIQDKVEISESKKENISKEKDKKTAFVEKFNKVKKGATNALKKVNSFTGISTGVAKGTVEGGLAAGAIAILGKNCKNGGGRIADTSIGILKDAGKALLAAPKALYNVFWKKSVKENLVSLGGFIKDSAKKLPAGVRKHGLTTAIASVVGISIFSYRVIEGMIKANQRNANLDHKTNQGHV